MKVEDVVKGKRVKVLSDSSGIIPVGAVGTIIENGSTIPWVSFDDAYSVEQQEICGYKNCKVMGLDEIEVLEENTSEEGSTKETNIGKLSVSLATEDVNSIAKDILKVVLQELYDGIEALSESLSKDLDEGEVSGDVTPKKYLMTEQYVLDKLLDQINIAINMDDDDSVVKLSEAYQRIKSVSINNNQTI